MGGEAHDQTSHDEEDLKNSDLVKYLLLAHLGRVDLLVLCGSRYHCVRVIAVP